MQAKSIIAGSIVPPRWLPEEFHSGKECPEEVVRRYAGELFQLAARWYAEGSNSEAFVGTAGGSYQASVPKHFVVGMTNCLSGRSMEKARANNGPTINELQMPFR